MSAFSHDLIFYFIVVPLGNMQKGEHDYFLLISTKKISDQGIDLGMIKSSGSLSEYRTVLIFQCIFFQRDVTSLCSFLVTNYEHIDVPGSRISYVSTFLIWKKL